MKKLFLVAILSANLLQSAHAGIGDWLSGTLNAALQSPSHLSHSKIAEDHAGKIGVFCLAAYSLKTVYDAYEKGNTLSNLQSYRKAITPSMKGILGIISILSLTTYYALNNNK